MGLLYRGTSFVVLEGNINVTYGGQRGSMPLDHAMRVWVRAANRRSDSGGPASVWNEHVIHQKSCKGDIARLRLDGRRKNPKCKTL